MGKAAPGGAAFFLKRRGSRPSASIDGRIPAGWRPAPCLRRCASFCPSGRCTSCKAGFPLVTDGGSLFGAPKRERKKRWGENDPPAITGKEPDQSGTAPSNEKYSPCLPAANEFNQFRAGHLTRAALPALSRSKPRARRLTAGLRKAQFKGQCVLPISCLPQRQISENAPRKPCRMKP